MTIFSRIINGEIPSYKVAEDDHCYAFLDINPLVKGHVLVVPKMPEPECDYIFRLDDNTLSRLMLFAKKVALAIEQSVPCKRVGVTVIGLEVNHVHIHLVPLNQESDMYFYHKKLQLPAEEMAEVANSIAEAFEKMN